MYNIKRKPSVFFITAGIMLIGGWVSIELTSRFATIGLVIFFIVLGILAIVGFWAFFKFGKQVMKEEWDSALEISEGPDDEYYEEKDYNEDEKIYL